MLICIRGGKSQQHARGMTTTTEETREGDTYMREVVMPLKFQTRLAANRKVQQQRIVVKNMQNSTEQIVPQEGNQKRSQHRGRILRRLVCQISDSSQTHRQRTERPALLINCTRLACGYNMSYLRWNRSAILLILFKKLCSYLIYTSVQTIDLPRNLGPPYSKQSDGRRAAPNETMIPRLFLALLLALSAA